MEEQEKYFLAQEPGGTDWYLIPTILRNHFIEWCQQEFYDEEWNKFKYGKFIQYRLEEGKNTSHEYIIV